MKILIPSLLLCVVSASLQAQNSIYSAPENLQVLAGDISPENLRETMKDFAIGTGLRCSSCHVGEEGQDLEEYDFASDDKPLKETARAMLEMQQDINGKYLATMGSQGISVTCETCHRGIPQPRFTGELLALAAAEGGAPAIRDQWSELRQQYYGTHSYDFSEWTLTEFARQRFGAGKPDEAVAALDILLEEDPESFQGHFMYGEMMNRQGNPERARKHYQKALEINPDAEPWVRPRLDALEAAG